MMLRLSHLDEVDAVLVRVGELVDAIESSEFDTDTRVRSWFIAAEGVFARNRRAATASTLASLRGALYALNLRTAAVGTGVARLTRRQRDVEVLAILDRGRETIVRAVEPDRTRMREAGDLMRQIVAIARHKSLPGTQPPGPSDPADVGAIWQVIIADTDLSTGATRILGLVTQPDAVALLDQALATPTERSGLGPPPWPVRTLHARRAHGSLRTIGERLYADRGAHSPLTHNVHSATEC
jgi:hypothetical protein